MLADLHVLSFLKYLDFLEGGLISLLIKSVDCTSKNVGPSDEPPPPPAKNRVAIFSKRLQLF
jgi:hypothetical protein